MKLLDIRNSGCQLCKLHQTGNPVCGMGFGNTTASIMVVGKMSNSKEYQRELEQQLTELGLDVGDVYFTQAVKCKTFDQSPSNGDVKKCRTYLEQEIEVVKPKWILALGNEALLSLTGHSGITKYRGKVFEGPHGTKVVASVSPSAVKRNPGQKPGYMADLRLFINKVKGREQGIAAPKYSTIDTREKLDKLKRILGRVREMDFDIETHGEYFDGGHIVSFSATCVLDDGRLFVFAIPLYHPESVWKNKHRAVLRYLQPELEAIPKVVAHNSSFDCKWMVFYGLNVYPTFDTMLAIHIMDENVQKGLKPQAMARLGVEPWGIDTHDLLNTPLKDILPYNVLDTWYMYHIKLQLVEELKEHPRLARIFTKLTMPAQRTLIDSEINGVWIDVPLLKKRYPEAEHRLIDVEERITEAAELPEVGSKLWPKDAKGKPREANFNASIFARWMLFDWCELPIVQRGKDKDDGSPGDPSMAEEVLLALKESHPVVPLMLERVTYQKHMSGFFKPYMELYDEEHRIHTNFKLAGTVTGRLSSGKEDADKITGGRGKMRGVNLQQVPRDPFIRGLFGAPPGWTFVEADYSQIELRVAAFVAGEDTMKHIYATNGDIHLTTAARVTQLPESQVTKEIRKVVGKPVNFGFLYGMGWRKFIQTAFNNYGSIFTEADARAARETYFRLYPKLLPWHQRQRRLVNEYGRVQSPLGRIRHLPDIYSPEQGVRAEAERQAINSPVQGFASDMAVLSMIHINDEFKQKNIPARCLGLVHDAINYEVRDDALGIALPIIKNTMEDMSLVRKKFGVMIDLPIIADVAVGQHWGDKLELTPAQVYDWHMEYKGK
jgi:uracil-DNA glycosylase family 4